LKEGKNILKNNALPFTKKGRFFYQKGAVLLSKRGGSFWKKIMTILKTLGIRGCIPKCRFDLISAFDIPNRNNFP
jgi:hypothetical protein